MARKTTAEKLAEVNAEMNELKNEKKQLLQKHKVEERKARTKRLIDRGAMLESLIENAAEFTNDQIAHILKCTVGSDFGVKIINQTKSQKTKTNTAPQGETPKRNGDVAATQIEIANESGDNVSAQSAENETEES